MKAFKAGLLIVLFFIGANLSAQGLTSFSVKGGLTLANLSGYDDSNYQVGLSGGISLDYAFSPKQDWFILTGLEYVTKGAKLGKLTIFDSLGEGLDMQESVNLGYIQLPVHVGYRSEGSKLIFHAGPYIAYGVYGKYKYSGDGSESNVDVFGHNQLKKIDFGAGIGVKGRFDPIEVGLGWDFGLTNIKDGDFDLWLPRSIKTQNGYLSVGYKF